MTQIPHNFLGMKFNLAYRHLLIIECSLKSRRLKTLNGAMGEKVSLDFFPRASRKFFHQFKINCNFSDTTG